MSASVADVVLWGIAWAVSLWAAYQKGARDGVEEATRVVKQATEKE